MDRSDTYLMRRVLMPTDANKAFMAHTLPVATEEIFAKIDPRLKVLTLILLN
jgi:hypothetical protein